MSKNSVREFGDAELLDELNRSKQELFELRFKLATGSLENTAAAAELEAAHRPHQHRAARAARSPPPRRQGSAS